MWSVVSAPKRKIERIYKRKLRQLGAMQAPLEHVVLVGTHHKTGTVWLKRIFSEAAATFDLKFCSSSAGSFTRDCNVFLESHSQFDLAGMPRAYRGIHIIRDPRDRIVSGCFYHQKSSEPWLHEKRAEFGNLSYQQKINTFSSDDDKLRFEMEHAGANTINEMLNWNYNNEHFYEVKYEDLIQDVNLELFHSIFVFLGFHGSAVPTLLQIAFDNSLFSGKVKKSLHVRSGMSSQWEKHFSEANRRRFAELFPDVLVQLGYEQNDGWVSR